MKRSQMIQLLKENNIPFKGNATNTVLADLVSHIVQRETPTEVVTAEIIEEPAGHETISMKISIDQVGLGADKGLGDNRLDYYLDVTVLQGQTMDLRKIAGNFAKQVYAGIQLLKDRSKGYNISFSIDNQLIANVRHGVNGRIPVGNPIDLAYCLLNLIVSQFDTSSGAELFGETVDNAGEVKLMLKKFNLDESMPLVFAQKAISNHRKGVKKAYAPVKA